MIIAEPVAAMAAGPQAALRLGRDGRQVQVLRQTKGRTVFGLGKESFESIPLELSSVETELAASAMDAETEKAAEGVCRRPASRRAPIRRPQWEPPPARLGRRPPAGAVELCRGVTV